MNKFLILALLAGTATLGYIARDSVEPTVVQAVSPVVEEPEAEPADENGKIPVFDHVVWVSEAEAKASGKPILYLATLSKGCVPCNQLAKLLDNPISAEAMNRFACVKLTDPPANHPWLRFYNVTRFPSMVFVGPKGTQPRVQSGSPGSVPALLQSLQFMEDRFSGKAAPAAVVPDATKTSIHFPPRPTLAPVSHDTVAPNPIKGRSSGNRETSCVACRVKGGRCVKPTPGLLRQWSFAPSARGRR